MKTVAIIPALDEEETIGEVVRELCLRTDAVVVVDNNSRDHTGERAHEAGAEVVRELERGYGAACLRGIRQALALGAECVLFLDGDGSDDPSEAPLLLEPIHAGLADLVIGVRFASTIAEGAMTPVQRFGNWLAPRLMRLIAGARYSDMPPFKAIRADALERLGLSDRSYGFTIEMLLKAHRERLRVIERKVHCRRRRGGKSKVSGTISGSACAGVRIVSTIVRHAQARR